MTQNMKNSYSTKDIVGAALNGAHEVKTSAGQRVGTEVATEKENKSRATSKKEAPKRTSQSTEKQANQPNMIGGPSVSELAKI